MMKGPGPFTTGNGLYQPKEFRWWYDSVIDWMITNPDKTLKDCATAHDCTPTTIYYITQSDVFKERYAERRSQINRNLHEAVVDRASRVAIKGLDAIETALDRSREGTKKIPLETLTEVTSKALLALGFGATKGPTVQVVNNTQVNSTAASPGAVEEARALIRRSQTEMAARPAGALEIEIAGEGESTSGSQKPPVASGLVALVEGVGSVEASEGPFPLDAPADPFDPTPGDDFPDLEELDGVDNLTVTSVFSL